MKSRKTYALLLILCFMLTSCIESKQELPSGCNVDELLLDLSDLPPGSELSTIGQPLPESTINSAGASFYLSSHLIGSATFWYSKEKYSIRKYKEEASAAGLVNKDNQSTPTELITKRLLADNYEVVCGDDVLVFRCIYVGRYKNYVTILNAEITEENLSFSEYSNLVEVLDKKISLCE